MVAAMDTSNPPATMSSDESDGTEGRRNFAVTILIAGSVAISFAGVLVRLIEGADSFQINFYRAVGQFGFVLSVLLIQYRFGVLSSIWRIGKPGMLAAVAICLASLAYMEAITTTTVANTLFVLAGIPLITAVMARIFLGEQLRRETLIAIVVATAGIAVMLGEGFGSGSGYGNGMAVLCACLFSTYAIIVRKHRALDMLPTLLVASSLLTVVSLIVKSGDVAVSTNDMAISLFWGVALIGVANWTFVVASRYLAAAEVTFFMLLEFAAGPLWVWLIIGETASTLTLVGGSLVFLAVAGRSWVQLSEGRRRRRGPKVGTP